MRCPARPSQRGGTVPCFGLPSRIFAQFGAQRAAVLSDQDIRSHGHGDWALRIAPQGETGNIQISGFFLDAARVRYYRGGAALQRQEFNVRQGLEQIQFADINAEVGDALARTRMHRENELSPGC